MANTKPTQQQMHCKKIDGLVERSVWSIGRFCPTYLPLLCVRSIAMRHMPIFPSNSFPFGKMRGRATAARKSTLGRWFLFERLRFLGRFCPGNIRAHAPFRFWKNHFSSYKRETHG